MDSSLEGSGFELPVPHAMQERLRAIIAGFGKPELPDYLWLLSADITEGELKPSPKSWNRSLIGHGTGSSNPVPSSGEFVSAVNRRLPCENPRGLRE